MERCIYSCLVLYTHRELYIQLFSFIYTHIHVANIEVHCKLLCILFIKLNMPISKYINNVLRLTHSMYVDIYNYVIPILLDCLTTLYI